MAGTDSQDDEPTVFINNPPSELTRPAVFARKPIHKRAVGSLVGERELGHGVEKRAIVLSRKRFSHFRHYLLHWLASYGNCRLAAPGFFAEARLSALRLESHFRAAARLQSAGGELCPMMRRVIARL
jgi:hypothetical protein